MLSFTLDTNCLIALANSEPDAPAVRALADADNSAEAHVAVVAVSASERQKNRTYLSDFTSFKTWLADLDLTHLEILRPIMYWGISFWDWCLWSDADMVKLERSIHDTLFPTMEFTWDDYCRAHCLDTKGPIAPRWRNAKCDVQALWCHIHYGRDVFVTADNNFHAPTKKSILIALGARQIVCPRDAGALL
jgi:hypothetical protein